MIQAVEAPPAPPTFKERIIHAADRRWVTAFAVTVMILTTLPYALGYAAGPDWRFTGFVFGVEDGNSYVAKMLSGAAGAWLFRTPYTPFPQQGVLAFLPYILLGKLAAPPGLHEQLTALFHLFRFGAGVLAILATGDFLRLFIEDLRLRRWTLALAVLGGGLGWVPVLLGQDGWLGSLPLEFYSPESFGFLALFGLPHLALARALLLGGFTVYLSPPDPAPAIETHSYRQRLAFDRRGAGVGILWLLLGLAQPLTVAIAWTITAAHLALFGASARGMKASGEAGQWWVYLRRAFWAVLVSSPLVVYTFAAFQLDPFLRSWQAQNLIPSPHPLHYLLAYGLLLPFAWIGARRLLRQDPSRAWLPAAWVLLLPFLAYAPYNLQRRLVEGVWVALLALAAGAVQSGDPHSLRRTLFRFSSLLLLPSTLLLFSGGLLAVQQPFPPIFRPADEAAAFTALAHAGQPGEVVLAAYDTGNALPAWAPVRVVIGHGPESAELPELRRQVTRFYQSSTGDEERLERISAYDIRYVFWGPQERLLGDWDPQQAAYLSLLVQAGEYQVYQVSSDDMEPEQ